MIRRSSLLVALALMGICVLAFAIVGRAAPTPPQLAQNDSQAVPVDVELVLAVDVSYSMDPDEQKLQREGYMEAITSTEFLRALREGIHAKIAVTYVEWAGARDQKVLVPWRLIEGPETADAFANEVGQAPYRRAMRTSISGALAFSAPLFDNSGYKGIRRVIDVSGDGVNNNGPVVTIVRDQVLAKGITINGLPIMIKRQSFGGMDIEELDYYYEDCVVGGPGAFVIPIKDRGKFRDATRTKLVMEVAGRMPDERVKPASSEAPRISCTVGERLWQERWGGRWDDR
jgi:hypothetical protein